jgi:cysteine synthase
MERPATARRTRPAADRHDDSPARGGTLIDQFIGRTPMVRLTRVPEPDMAEVWVKLEGMNPGASIKDRTALALIRDGERRGLLRPGSTVVEPTSGNTGIGLAQVATARGYRLVLCMPATMSIERRRTLEAYGAELVLTDPERRMLAAIEEAERIRDQTGAYLPDQFGNPANPQIHYETTAPEIWDAMDGRIDAFVYGSGTGGTISGVGRFLKERRPEIQVVAVEPARSAVLSPYDLRTVFGEDVDRVTLRGALHHAPKERLYIRIGTRSAHIHERDHDLAVIGNRSDRRQARSPPPGRPPVWWPVRGGGWVAG